MKHLVFICLLGFLFLMASCTKEPIPMPDTKAQFLTSSSFSLDYGDGEAITAWEFNEDGFLREYAIGYEETGCVNVYQWEWTETDQLTLTLIGSEIKGELQASKPEFYLEYQVLIQSIDEPIIEVVLKPLFEVSVPQTELTLRLI